MSLSLLDGRLTAQSGGAMLSYAELSYAELSYAASPRTGGGELVGSY